MAGRPDGWRSQFGAATRFGAGLPGGGGRQSGREARRPGRGGVRTRLVGDGSRLTRQVLQAARQVLR